MRTAVARTIPRAARASRQQTIRKYATPAAERPEGYIPTGEEWLAERAAVQAHAKGKVEYLTHTAFF